MIVVYIYIVPRVYIYLLHVRDTGMYVCEHVRCIPSTTVLL